MASTLEFRLTTGGLGGAATSTVVSGTAMNNIFDDVSAAEANSGDTEYRAIDVYNTGDATAVSVEIYLSSETTSADSVLNFAKSATDLNSTVSIADESTQPASTTFAHHLTGNKLALTDIPAGEYSRVWFQRVIDAGAVNTANDTATFEVIYA